MRHKQGLQTNALHNISLLLASDNPKRLFLLLVGRDSSGTTFKTFLFLSLSIPLSLSKEMR